MSERIQQVGRIVIIWASVLGIAVSVASTWLIMPQRLEAVEKRQTDMEARIAIDRELLIRIEERLKQIQDELRNRK